MNKQNPFGYPGLTFRQTEFCRLYAQGASAQQAARMAGYAETFAEHKAYRMLRTPAIQICIRAFLETGRIIVPPSLVDQALSTLQKVMAEGQNEHAMVAAARIVLFHQRKSTIPVYPLEEPTLPSISEEPEYVNHPDLEPHAVLEILAEEDETRHSNKPDPTDDTATLQVYEIDCFTDRKQFAKTIEAKLSDEFKTAHEIKKDKEWDEHVARRREQWHKRNQQPQSGHIPIEDD